MLYLITNILILPNLLNLHYYHIILHHILYFCRFLNIFFNDDGIFIPFWTENANPVAFGIIALLYYAY